MSKYDLILLVYFGIINYQKKKDKCDSVHVSSLQPLKNFFIFPNANFINYKNYVTKTQNNKFSLEALHLFKYIIVQTLFANYENETTVEHLQKC